MATTDWKEGINHIRHEFVGWLKSNSSSAIGANTVYYKRYGTMAWDYGIKGRLYDIANNGWLNVIDTRGGTLTQMDISMPSSSSTTSHGVYVKTADEEFIMYHRYSSYWYKIYTDWDVSYANITHSPTSSQYGAGSVFLGSILNSTAGTADDDSVYTYLREETKLYKYSVSSNSWTTMDYSSDPNMSGLLNTQWNGALGWNWKDDGKYLYLIVRNSSKVPYLAKYDLTTGTWEEPQRIHNAPYYMFYGSTYRGTMTFDGKRTFFGMHPQNASSDEEYDKYQSRVLFMIREEEDGVYYYPIGRAPTGYRFMSTFNNQSQWIQFVEVEGVGYIYYINGVSEPNDHKVAVYRAFVEHLR